MPIIKWSPMSDPFQDFDRFFEDFHSARSFMPAVDVYQNEKSVTVEASLPGIDPDSVDVSVENDALMLQGKSEKQSEVDEKNYYRKEVAVGAFHRVIPLPAAVDGEKAKASYKDGILKVEIPKQERVLPKKIKIAKEDKYSR